MWHTSPSIVHQDVTYTAFNQLGIDFAIGRYKKAKDLAQEDNKGHQKKL